MKGKNVFVEGMEKCFENLKKATDDEWTRMRTEFLTTSKDAWEGVQKMTPVDTGKLKGALFKRMEEVPGVSIFCHIGWSHSAVPYGIYVHECLYYRHSPPTQAQFVRIPCKTAMEKLRTRLRGKPRGKK